MNIHGDGSPIKVCYEPNHYENDCKHCALRYTCGNSRYNTQDLLKKCYKPLPLTCQEVK